MHSSNISLPSSFSRSGEIKDLSNDRPESHLNDLLGVATQYDFRLKDGNFFRTPKQQPTCPLKTHCILISDEDKDQLSLFVRETISRGLISWLETTIKYFSDQTSSRRGISKYITVTKRFFSRDHKTISSDSDEAHTDAMHRRLADISFLFQDYLYAYSCYKSIGNELAAKQPHSLEYASALQMMALSYMKAHPSKSNLALQHLKYASELFAMFSKSRILHHRLVALTIEVLLQNRKFATAADWSAYAIFTDGYDGVVAGLLLEHVVDFLEPRQAQVTALAAAVFYSEAREFQRDLMVAVELSAITDYSTSESTVLDIIERIEKYSSGLISTDLIQNLISFYSDISLIIHKETIHIFPSVASYEVLSSSSSDSTSEISTSFEFEFDFVFYAKYVELAKSVMSAEDRIRIFDNYDDSGTKKSFRIHAGERLYVRFRLVNKTNVCLKCSNARLKYSFTPTDDAIPNHVRTVVEPGSLKDIKLNPNTTTKTTLSIRPLTEGLLKIEGVKCDLSVDIHMKSKSGLVRLKEPREIHVQKGPCDLSIKLSKHPTDVFENQIFELESITQSKNLAVTRLSESNDSVRLIIRAADQLGEQQEKFVIIYRHKQDKTKRLRSICFAISTFVQARALTINNAITSSTPGLLTLQVSAKSEIPIQHDGTEMPIKLLGLVCCSSLSISVFPGWLESLLASEQKSNGLVRISTSSTTYAESGLIGNEDLASNTDLSMWCLRFRKCDILIKSAYGMTSLGIIMPKQDDLMITVSRKCESMPIVYDFTHDEPFEIYFCLTIMNNKPNDENLSIRLTRSSTTSAEWTGLLVFNINVKSMTSETRQISAAVFHPGIYYISKKNEHYKEEQFNQLFVNVQYSDADLVDFKSFYFVVYDTSDPLRCNFMNI
ncbi:hypothetical protein ACOME3_000069 [Neoechinorhynchus agilis]